MGLAVAMGEHTGPLVASATEDPGIYAVPGFRRDMASVDPLSTRRATDLSDVALSGSSGLDARVGMLTPSHVGRAHMALVSPRRNRRPVSEVTGLHGAFGVGDGRDDPIPALDATRPVRTA